MFDTPQEIFSTALQRLVAQGEPSVDEEHTCVYRYVKDGKVLGCGVGILLDKDLAELYDSPETYGWNINAQALRHCSETPQWIHDNLALLSTIQETHDNATMVDNWLGEFKERMRAVADEFKLEYTL